MLMGYREYARHRGCVLSAVQKAVDTGRIKTVEVTAGAKTVKKIDSEAADLAWAASTDPAKQRKEPPTPPPPPPTPLLDGEVLQAPPGLTRRPEWPEITEPWPPPMVVKPPEPPAANVVGMDTFLAAKTDRERAEAELAKLELLEKQGRLVDREEVQQVWRAIGKMYRQARDNEPTDLATQLVGKSDPREIEQILRRAFRATDTRVANEIEARYAEVVDDVRSSIAG